MSIYLGHIIGNKFDPKILSAIFKNHGRSAFEKITDDSSYSQFAKSLSIKIKE